jgi:hypothetical protein
MHLKFSNYCWVEYLTTEKTIFWQLHLANYKRVKQLVQGWDEYRRVNYFPSAPQRLSHRAAACLWMCLHWNNSEQALLYILSTKQKCRWPVGRGASAANAQGSAHRPSTPMPRQTESTVRAEKCETARTKLENPSALHEFARQSAQSVRLSSLSAECSLPWALG